MGTCLKNFKDETDVMFLYIKNIFLYITNTAVITAFKKRGTIKLFTDTFRGPQSKNGVLRSYYTIWAVFLPVMLTSDKSWRGSQNTRVDRLLGDSWGSKGTLFTRPTFQAHHSLPGDCSRHSPTAPAWRDLGTEGITDAKPTAIFRSGRPSLGSGDILTRTDSWKTQKSLIS